MKRTFKHILQWISKRSILFVTLLLFGVGVLLILLLVTGFSQTNIAITLGIAATSAFFAAISSIASLLQAVEIQRQREAQERPYVTVYFDASNRGFMFFIIRNSGNSPAIDVTFKFDPAPIDHAGRPLTQISLFQKPISFLPPGKHYKQLLDASHRFLAEGKTTKYKVTVIYSSTSGELFKEVTEFDLSYMRQSNLPGKSVEENLEDISKHIKDLNALLGSVKGWNALLVETPEQNQKKITKMAQEVRRKAKAKPPKINK
jgi:hypothetical protein